MKASAPAVAKTSAEIEALPAAASNEHLFDGPPPPGERSHETMHDLGHLKRGPSAGNRSGANGQAERADRPLTYAELREKHRAGQGRPGSHPAPQDGEGFAELEKAAKNSGTGPVRRRNKYGDEIE